MSAWVVDIETNALDNATQLWCIVCQNEETQEIHTFVHDDYFQHHSDWPVQGQHKVSEFKDWAKDKITQYIGHNYLSFDNPYVKHFTGLKVENKDIIDTLIWSRIASPLRDGNHGLESWGFRFKYPKIHFKDFDVYSNDMVLYCIQDVRLNMRVYQYLKPTIEKFSKRSVQLEHGVQAVIDKIRKNGFYFDMEFAHKTYAEIKAKCDKIEKEIKDAFPPVKKYEKKPHILKYKKNGEMAEVSKKFLANKQYDTAEIAYPTGTWEKETYFEFSWEEFNLGSPKQVVERMTEAGWKPTVFKKASETQKKKGLNKGSPQLCEENFQTLPETAPESAKKIVKWLTYNSRCKKLEECFDLYNPETGCVHGQIFPLGAATHRMTHRAPNMANLPKVKLDKEGHVIWGEAGDYASELRRCFTTRDKKTRDLVGIDLSGIQLRAFAHYINNEAFSTQLISGDIHSFNRDIISKIIEDYCKQMLIKPESVEYLKANEQGRRNFTKTFCYAYLFGAGSEKVGTIFGFPKSWQSAAGTYIKEMFAKEIIGLEGFRNKIKKDAKLGYMFAIDGRLIQVPSAHLGLSIYLQSFEAIIMKYALYKLDKIATEKGLDFQIVAVVHDESQIDVRKDQTEEIGKLMVECMEEAGRYYKVNLLLTGEYKVSPDGSWAGSH